MTQSNFPKAVKILTTPRYLAGGASVDCYKNFNLATHTGDNSVAIKHNRELLVEHYNLPSMPKWLNQTHSDICVDAKSDDCEADAVITHQKGVICAVMTADCLPIFACNQAATQVGVAHAGWQGILNGVIEAFVEKFDQRDLLVHFGAAISAKNFNISKEIFEQFVAKDIRLGAAFTRAEISGEKYHLDIYKVARIILNNLGIDAVSGGDQCTFEQADKYFSYRRDGVNSGRMAHLIWL